MSSLNFTHIKKTKKSIFQGVHYDKNMVGSLNLFLMELHI